MRRGGKPVRFYLPSSYKMDVKSAVDTWKLLSARLTQLYLEHLEVSCKLSGEVELS